MLHSQIMQSPRKRAFTCCAVLWLQCYGHAEQQVVNMELDRREKEALEAESRLQSIGAKGQ